MNSWIDAFGIIGIVAAVVIVGWNHYRTKKTMDTIEGMLDSALQGSFSEKRFDESRISALETKFAQYLSACETASHQLEKERDKIKTMISDISHQTKTPIANLLLYSELLEEENLEKEAKENVQALHSQTEKLRFLIDSLVKLSRLENGILNMNPSTGKLYPMLEKVEKQNRLAAEEKGLYLRLEPTQEGAVFDEKWTSEALCNVVDNAIKYTEQGGVTIRVIAYELFVCIRIEDSGWGIEEEEQPKVFSRFYRSSMAETKEGVGIGLYLARKIIMQQGGYMKLTSQRGQGSIFSIFLQR